MSAIDTVAELAEQLTQLIADAKLVPGFDETGIGPFVSMVDSHLVFPEKLGPIRSTAKRLRAALLDLESERRTEATR